MTGWRIGAAVLAVDDVGPALDELRRLLSAAPGVEEVETAPDALAACGCCRRAAFDAVFLDIAMPGMDGMELAALFTRMTEPPAIVFVTAFDEHAAAAYQIGAVDYLLKPISAERLAAALDRVRRFAAPDPRREPPAGRRARRGAHRAGRTHPLRAPRRRPLRRGAGRLRPAAHPRGHAPAAHPDLPAGGALGRRRVPARAPRLPARAWRGCGSCAATSAAACSPTPTSATCRSAAATPASCANACSTPRRRAVRVSGAVRGRRALAAVSAHGREARHGRQPADPAGHGAPLGRARGVPAPRPRRPGARPPDPPRPAAGRPRRARPAHRRRRRAAAAARRPPRAGRRARRRRSASSWLAVAVLPYGALVAIAVVQLRRAERIERRDGGDAAVIGVRDPPRRRDHPADRRARGRRDAQHLGLPRRVPADLAHAQRRGGVGGVPLGGVVPRRRRARREGRDRARCGTRSGSPRATWRCSRSSPRPCAARAR